MHDRAVSCMDTLILHVSHLEHTLFPATILSAPGATLIPPQVWTGRINESSSRDFGVLQHSGGRYLRNLVLPKDLKGAGLNLSACLKLPFTEPVMKSAVFRTFLQTMGDSLIWICLEEQNFYHRQM